MKKAFRSSDKFDNTLGNVCFFHLQTSGLDKRAVDFQIVVLLIFELL